MPLLWLFLVSLSQILTTFLLSITGTEAAATNTTTSSMHSYNGGSSSSSSRRIGDWKVEEEFLMDTETHRRLLEQGQKIGYGALQPDRPACNAGPGQSYSGNCIPAPSGNKPNRGCERNFYCRSGHQ